MLRPQPATLARHHDRLAGQEIGEVDGERQRPVEVDQSGQGLGRLGVLVDGRAAPRVAGQEQSRQHRVVEPRPADQPGMECRCSLSGPARIVAAAAALGHRIGHPVPECPQPLDAPGRRVAGDQGGIDGADRAAGQTVRPQALRLQGVVDARPERRPWHRRR